MLPNFLTMTPELLDKLEALVHGGATIIGPPPRKSPSLVGYPSCDLRIVELADKLWGAPGNGAKPTARSHGQGRVIPTLPGKLTLDGAPDPEGKLDLVSRG